MGCGASAQEGVGGGGGDHVDGLTATKSNNNEKMSSDMNGHVVQDSLGGSADRQGKASKNKVTPGAVLRPLPPGPVPKPVAFDITLGGNTSKIDSIISKHPPKRLARLALDPIQDVPRMTPEMLEMKQKLAEEKRLQQLERKREVGRRSSKLRREVQQAKEFEKVQAQELLTEVDEKQKSAGKKRDARLHEIEEKKRLREERARKVRERAKKMKQEEDLGFDVEKDEAFNGDDDDSWLDGENNRAEIESMGERIYSGHESPHKKVHGGDKQIRLITSASTTDSFDFAFQRDPNNPRAANQEAPDSGYDRSRKNDDFFDS